MVRCEHCGINLADNPAVCPLCDQATTFVDATCVCDYPRILTGWALRIILRLLALLTVGALIVVPVINLLNPTQVWWSVIVIGGILYAWLSLFLVLRARRNIGLLIFVQLLAISGLCLVVNWTLGGFFWSLNYVIPMLVVLSVITITGLMLLRPMLLRDVFIYLLIIAAMGGLSVLLILLDAVTVLWTWVTASVYCILTLVGLFLFADRRTKHELKKRFHF
jgi:hypothetical protein